MANLSDLRNLFSKTQLKNRVEAQLIKSVTSLGTAEPGAVNDRAFMIKCLGNTKPYADMMFLSVLAINADATVANILAASESTIETNINNILPAFIKAEAGE